MAEMPKNSQDEMRRGQQKPMKGMAGDSRMRDIPDESKERHTEIAVEAGRKGVEEMERMRHEETKKP